MLTTAEAGLAATMLPILTALQTALPWIIGIGAAIGVIAIGIKAYKDAHPSLEMLQKDANAAKQEFEDMQSKVEETGKRIEELNKLKEEGTISPAQEKELSNLESQNKLYERQAELLGRIAELKNEKVSNKANEDFTKYLRQSATTQMMITGWGPEGPVMSEVQTTKGVGGLQNRIEQYQRAKQYADQLNDELMTAQLEGKNLEELEDLSSRLEQAQTRLAEAGDALSDDLSSLIEYRDLLTDPGLIDAADILIDGITDVVDKPQTAKTFDQFKEDLKSLSEDTKKYLDGMVDGLDPKEVGQGLADFLKEYDYTVEEFAYFYDMLGDAAEDASGATTNATNAQISDLTTLRDELSLTAQALEKYKAALEGGEKGDAAKQMADVYKAAMEDINAGRLDTYNLQAAADLFFSQDWLASNDYDLSAVGEALSSGIWDAVFNAEGDYGVAFANYIKDNLSGFGDVFDITEDLDTGSFKFAYSSIADVAEACNMSEEAVTALLDALDALGVEVMMSKDDMNQLIGSLDFSDGIDGVIEQLNDGKRSAYDIVKTLKALDAEGAIDLSGVDNLGERVKDIIGNVTDLDSESSEPTVEVQDNATDTLENIKTLLAEISAGASIPITVTGGGIGGFIGKAVKAGLGFASGTRSAPGGPALLAEGDGPELVSDNGHVELVGLNGPEIRNLHKGATVLNADETRKVLGGKYRNIPKVGFANGTAKAGSIANKVKQKTVTYVRCPRCGYGGNVSGQKTCTVCGWDLSQDYHPYNSVPLANGDKAKKSSSGSGSGGEGGGGATAAAAEGTEIVDWIEVALDRIERKVKSLSRIAESSFKKLATRLGASKDEIATITEEIDKQRQGYERYLQEANSVGLSEDLATLVRDGTIDIRKYDKDTKKLIDDYQQWYTKAIDCSDAVEELNEALSELYEDRFEAVQSDYENRLGDIEHMINMYGSALDAHEKSGYMASAEYYEELSKVRSSNVELLKAELSDLRSYMREAMDSGTIDEGSEAYYKMKQEIQSVEEALADANIQLIECANSMREIKWDYFDYALNRMSRLTDETEFLVELMSSSKLFDGSGNMTSEGLSTLGMRAVNYDTYMAQADRYAREMGKIDKEIASDPYNTTLIDRREKLLDLQRDAILAAQQEKEAVKSLVSDGFQEELKSLKDLIDSYTDALDSAKDLHDYEKKLSKQTENLSNIQKQLAAYQGDTSEENRSRLQKLRKQLQEAEEELQETQYDQYIKDQKELLGTLYDDYEKILNDRLDNIDELFNDMLMKVDDNAENIQATITEVGQSVGYAVSDGLREIFTGSDAVAKYGMDSAVTGYLDTIEAAVVAMAQANDVSISGAIKQYASGGLIDYTGFAKVDGTPGKPELVLNHRDTSNFLALRDVLRTPYLSALSGKSQIYHFPAMGGGAAIGEINIPISIERVQDYNDFIRQLQSDPKAERIIQAMTIDQVAGKSSLRARYMS